MRSIPSTLTGFALFASMLLPLLRAQTVQPLITELQGRGEGKFAITNNTLEPMIANIEPRSFSIDEAGKGVFRKLDTTIHLELSAMSVRLQPSQTYYVFYKATAETMPAWFSIYTTFIPLRHTSTLEVRIQLPHTVYLYQKTPLAAQDVSVRSLVYDKVKKKIILEVQNMGSALGRVQEIHPLGKSNDADTLAGFPLLPGATRRVELSWEKKELPRGLQILFSRFKLEPTLTEVTALETPALPSAVGTK